MSLVRALVALVIVLLALVVQVSVFGQFAWNGVVPNLCLLVVVGAGLTRGPDFAMMLGFLGGIALDLAPPADHVAGRWALALVVVGYVAGRVAQGGRPPVLAVLATVAACSFLGSSVFTLTGLLLRDPVSSFSDLLAVILMATAWDLLLTPFVLPPVMALMRRPDGRVRAERVAA